MKWTEVPAGTINAATQRFWVALGDNADIVAKRINTDPGFVENLAVSSLKPTRELRARKIMGDNFFGIEEAAKHYKVIPSEQKLATLAEFRTPSGLISDDELIECKDTHILAAVFPMSILDIRRSNVVGFNLFGRHEDDQSFARDCGEVGWQFVRKTPVTESTGKTWDEQQELLDENEKTPYARVMIYAIVGHFLNTGERLFEKIHARCWSTGSGGHRLIVGSSDKGTISIYEGGDGDQNPEVGLSAVRK